MTVGKTSRTTRLVAFVVMSIAIVGYFTGLQAPMPETPTALLAQDKYEETEGSPNVEDGVILATSYTNIAEATRKLRRRPQLMSFKPTIDPLVEIKVVSGEKLAALQRREQRRAYNGAPPTIPHLIDQRTDASCVACHREGVLTKSLRIPRLSHAILTNCTQCHVENRSRHMTPIVFRDSNFEGLAAPTEGPRSFAGAPPQIPHSTWMRSDCMSCHGYAGLHGIRTTHPWRTNCQQCHAPSATMDQTLLAEEPRFLPGPTVSE